MTIAELHDYCRYLFDENHVHGVPDKWSEGYEFALSRVRFKCQEGLTDEDLKKALWFINDALDHTVPPIAAWNGENACAIEALADRLLEILATENWADLGRFWLELEHGTAWTARLALIEKINEIGKDGE